ncbi:MAG: transcriptional regulator [Anaerolineae bacterium]|nr:transcriptional regulator [Anaerolineae bacterium]
MSTQLINRTERLATIEKMLFHAPSGLRVVEIAQACEVDRRTIYRDLALMSEIGVPVYQKDGRFFLNHEYYVATVHLNINELLALYIAGRGLAHFTHEQNPHVISALKKLSKNLPDALAQHVRSMIEIMRSSPVDRAFVLVLETITRAWVEQRKVKLWYRSSNRASVSIREFATYFIEPAANGGMYAVGYDYLSQKVGAVRLQYIKRVQILPSEYEIPMGLEPQRYTAGAWGMMRSSLGERPMKVVLAFAPDIIPAVRERLRQAAHPVAMTSDSRSVVSFQVADWRDVLPWIRSWGAQVEVLEPKALRDLIAAEALRLAAVYDSPGVASSP